MWLNPIKLLNPLLDGEIEHVDRLTDLPDHIGGPLQTPRLQRGLEWFSVSSGFSQKAISKNKKSPLFLARI